MSKIQELLERATVERAETHHEMSLSDDPIEAASGRFLKVVDPVIQTWLRAEVDRRTDFGVVIVGLSKALTREMLTLTLSGAKPGHAASALRALRDAIAADFDKLLDAGADSIVDTSRQLVDKALRE